ncbi:MAG: D-aminoacyl-tRNA deacylase [Nitrososphaerales archaeon]
MKTVIINSALDPAGSNIHDRLVEEFGYKEIADQYDGLTAYGEGEALLVTSKKEILFVEDLDDYFPDCRYVFISKHWAESGIPSLTAHFAGNFGKNEFGGNPGEIARFSPSMLKRYFSSLNLLRDEIPQTYSLTLEATHHGPTSLKAPVLFVELGSGPEQWKDPNAARWVCEALVNSLQARNDLGKCALAFGGVHYSQKFNKFVLESGFKLGPIVPKYALEFLDKGLMEQLTQKGDQRITHAVLDMKGLGSHKEKVVKLVSEFELETIRV